MRRLAASSFLLLATACQPPAPRASESQTEPDREAAPKPEAAPEPKPPPPEPKTHPDLLATDLPPIPALDLAEHAVADAGTFPTPEGTDELAPRAAVMTKAGLLLVGQAYFQRTPRRVSKSWRWLGLAELGAAPGVEPRSTKSEPGAIRAAIPHAGGALVVGTNGIGFDMRGWFGIVDDAGGLDFEVTLESPNTTELFDLVPGAPNEKAELAIAAGYVDAQAWVVSLDAGGMPRWQRYIGSYGYTQIRGLARVDGPRPLAAIGSRAQKFGESWVGTIPLPGPDDAELLDAAGVEQASLTIEGADPNQLLTTLVDAGEHGLFALGTAKRNIYQAHDQVLVVGLDRSGRVRFAKVAPQVRVTTIHAGTARSGGGASFVASIPGPEGETLESLALIEVGPEGAITARELADSRGWSSAGFVEGADALALVTTMQTQAGLAWRRSLLP